MSGNVDLIVRKSYLCNLEVSKTNKTRMKNQQKEYLKPA